MSVVQKADERGNFVQAEDGFWYYFPTGSGFLSAWDLRVLARELDRRNAEWQAIIDNDPAANGSEPAPEMDEFDD